MMIDLIVNIVAYGLSALAWGIAIAGIWKELNDEHTNELSHDEPTHNDHQ